MTNISIIASHALHKGGTKHYSALLIRVVDTERASNILVRMYGGVGKKATIKIENATGGDEYHALITKKGKGGYTGIDIKTAQIFNISVPSGTLGSYLKNTFTYDLNNITAKEYTSDPHVLKSAPLTSFLREAELNAIKAALLNDMTLDGMSVELPTPSVDTSLLQQKRVDTYGEQWGGW